MKKVLKATIMSSVAVALVICVSFALFSVSAANNEPVQKKNIPIVFQDANVSGEIAEVAGENTDEAVLNDEVTAKLVSMLDLNGCYNDSFDDIAKTAACTAISLSSVAGYGVDADGYGICVSTGLVAGFMKEFYGSDIDFSEITDPDAPDGYILVPVTDGGTYIYSLVSAELNDGVYTVVACRKGYSGGNEYDTALVKAEFVKNNDSVFGFNMVRCEML